MVTCVIDPDSQDQKLAKRLASLIVSRLPKSLDGSLCLRLLRQTEPFGDRGLTYDFTARGVEHRSSGFITYVRRGTAITAVVTAVCAQSCSLI